MNMKIKKTLAILAVSTMALTGCGSSEYSERKEAQKTQQLPNSLEKQNLEKKRQKENDPSAERYIYLMNYGEIVGYYVAIGKISSSASQIGPESEVIRGYGGEGYILDSAKDDGSYGAGDPGIFFFTADGVMVETSLDYIVSDQPIAVDVPRLQQ